MWKSLKTEAETEAETKADAMIKKDVQETEAKDDVLKANQNPDDLATQNLRHLVLTDQDDLDVNQQTSLLISKRFVNFKTKIIAMVYNLVFCLVLLYLH